MNLGLSFLDYKNSTHSHRLVSIATSQGVPHASDKILIPSPFAGTNFENLKETNVNLYLKR